MAITTRTLFIATFIGFSILCISLYIYSNGYYKNKQLSKVEIKLSNGTKILTNNKDDKSQTKVKLGFIHAFIASISVIVVSELGDKTFFIAAIMAMRHSRLIIYIGAMSALGAMTILSALLGNIVTNFIPRLYTYYLSSILFACFGIKMLRDGYIMSPDEGTGEYDEVQHEVEKAEATDDLELGGGISTTSNQQQQRSQSAAKQRNTVTKLMMILRRYVSPILIQAFIMTFLAVSIWKN
jgi:putative Ca2+/H+ antiporter (TMEM165/GDT1 family)